MAHYAASTLSATLCLWNRNSYQVPHISAPCTHCTGSDLNSVGWETFHIAVTFSIHSRNITSFVFKFKEKVQNCPKWNQPPGSVTVGTTLLVAQGHHINYLCKTFWTRNSCHSIPYISHNCSVRSSISIWYAQHKLQSMYLQLFQRH